MRKNIKKLTAVALTVAMTMGSAMTAFAADGDLSGDGSYEGGEMKYPAISVTLPTVPEGIDYIADPNDLINMTKDASGDAAKDAYKNYDFNGNTGIYFKTKQASGDAVRGEYSQESAPMAITNENAQDLTVSVTLAKTSEASGDVQYSDTAAFASGDAAKKIYLAVTDGATTRALSASASATLTTDIAGNPGNFDPKYDPATDTYGYVKKTDDGLSWSDATYKLTGAINKGAKWGDAIGVPNIKVTWQYGEKQTDVAPSIATKSYTVTSGRALNVTVDLGAGAKKATGIASVTNVTLGRDLASPTNYTYSGNTLTFTSDFATWVAGKTTPYTIRVTFNNSEHTAVDITLGQ